MSEDIEIIGIEEVAELLGVSVRTVQRHIAKNKGHFPGRQIGGKWIFDREQIIDWVRGDWQPIAKSETQMELIEEETRRLGVDRPETFIEMQQHARKKR